MGRSVGEERSAVLSASCAEICSGPKMNGASLHVREVSGCARRAKFLINTWTTPIVPIDYLVNLNGVQNATFGGTNMAYNCDFASADKRLLTGERSSTIFHSLHYSIDILKMLPNEAANSTILWNCLKGSIIISIGRRGDMPRARLRSLNARKR